LDDPHITTSCSHEITTFFTISLSFEKRPPAFGFQRASEYSAY
jgi:hypothetical protein